MMPKLKKIVDHATLVKGLPKITPALVEKLFGKTQETSKGESRVWLELNDFHQNIAGSVFDKEESFVEFSTEDATYTLYGSVDADDVPTYQMVRETFVPHVFFTSMSALSIEGVLCEYNNEFIGEGARRRNSRIS